VTFNTGDIVEITGPADMSEWIGMRARVVAASDAVTYSTCIELTGGRRRPDGYGDGSFFWDTDGLVAVPVTGADGFAAPAPAPELPQVGGRVRFLTAYVQGASATVGAEFEILTADPSAFHDNRYHIETTNSYPGSRWVFTVPHPGLEILAPAPVVADPAPEQSPEARVFAVGDRVRILEAEGVYGTDIGRIGVITRLNAGGGNMGYDQPHPYRVEMDDNLNTWDVAVVELVEAAPQRPLPSRSPQVGDRVRLTAADIGGDAETGDLGTIREITGPDSFDIHFDGRRSGARGGGVHHVRRDEFELVEAASSEPRPHPSGFAIGDRVQLTRTWSGVPAGTTGVVTMQDDLDAAAGRNFAVRFDGLEDGGFYGGGEYIVESRFFGRFIRSDGRPLPVPGRIVAGSKVVLKEVSEYRDNNKPAVTNYMAFGSVYTVREIDDGNLMFRLDGVDGGWSTERFKHAPVEIAPEAAPEPDPVSA
jgi:hypothetical protein